MIDGKPMADSRDLVGVFDIQHRSIYRLIKIHEEKLNNFGKVRFEITPTESGQFQSMAYLNEPQAMLLMTYTKSNPKTDSYRVKLVSDFVKLREYVRNQEALRISGIQTRKTLTESLDDSGENERMHGHGYSTYTKMVYEICGLKYDYNQWKNLSGVSRPFRETLCPEQLKRVELAEYMIKPLLELEKQYKDIKDTLKPIFEMQIEG